MAGYGLTKPRVTPGFGLRSNFDTDVFSNFDNWLTSIESVFPKSNISLYEMDGNYIATVPISGVRAEDVDISVDGREVTIHATYEVSPPEGAKPIWEGYVAGEYRETFTLPTTVYSDESSASYENGVLTLTLPRAEKSHKIPVNNKEA